MNSRTRAGAALLVFLCSAAAVAAPSGTLVVGAVEDSTGQPAASALTGEQIDFTLSYTLTGAPNGGTLSVDLCAPFAARNVPYGAPQYAAISAGVTDTYLGSCADGDGNPGLGHRLSWSVSSTTGGNTGNVFFWALSRVGVTTDGAVWTIPARIDVDGAEVVSASAQITLHTSAPAFTLQTSFDHADLAPAPDGSGRNGFNAAFLVQPGNDVSIAWWGPRTGAAPAPGTTSIIDTPSILGSGAPPALVTGATWLNPPVSGGGLANFTAMYGPAWSGVDLNPTQTVATDLSSLSTTIDSMLTDAEDIDFGGAAYYVNFWVPLDAGDVQNAVTLSSGGSTVTATAQAYLGNVDSYLSLTNDNGYGNNYGCGSGTYRPDIDPTQDDDCFVGPDGAFVQQMEGIPRKPVTHEQSAWVNPRLIVHFDPTVQLAGAPSWQDCCAPGWRNDPAGWVVEYSEDTNCGPATPDASWAQTPPDGIDAATCYRLRYAGVYSIGYGFYGIADMKLRPSARTGIVNPGDYLIGTDSAWVVADNEISVNEDPSEPPVSFTSTFWETEWLNGWMGPTQAADSNTTLGQVSVGDTFYLQFQIPSDGYGYNLEDRSGAGFTDLKFQTALPPEVRMAGALAQPYTVVTNPVDNQGNPAIVTCTSNYLGPDDLTQPPNTFQCEVTTADRTNNIPPHNLAGLTNTLTLGVPLELVGGTKGESLQFTGSAWTTPPAAYANGTIPPPPIEQPGAVDRILHLANSISVGGAEDLRVDEETLATTVVQDGTVEFDIHYSNGGSVSSTGTTVTALLGYDSATGGALPAGCAAAAPQLVSASVTGGAPQATLQFTTDVPPSPGGNWSPGPLPADSTTVTGVRWLLNSEFSPVQGTYSPLDQPGSFQLLLRAPDAAGSSLCSTVAIAASDLAPASASASVPITAFDPCAGVVCPSDACNTSVCVAATGQCATQPVTDGTACNDGNACTQGDVCTAGACGGTQVVCAAPDACHTAGTCDPNNGCPMATLSPGYCSIGGACVAAGATAPGNPCEVCTPADSTSAYTAVVTTAQAPTIQIANAATSTAGGLPTLPALGGATVVLDASGTSAPGEALSYVWQQSGATAGTTPVLLSQVDSTGAVVSFVAPVLPDDLSGPLTLQFTVTATATLACAAAPASSSEVVAVIIDEPPIAIATVKQTSTCGGFNSQGAVCGGQTVTLDGSSSTDPNGVGIATYTWTQLGSAQTTPVVLSPAQGETVSFTAPTLTTSTTLTFALVVTDKLGLQSVNTNNTVSVTVKAQNETPIADSGSNQTVTQGATVKLSSAGSYDPDGDPVTYLWKQTGGPGVCLSGASSACGGGCSNTSTQANPTFKAPQLSSCGGAKSQVLTFQLVVTDQPTSSQCGGPLASAPSTVTVTVVEPLQPPVANAGSAQTVNDGATVQLDGSQSSDPQGEPLTFKWLQVSGPAATLSNSTAVRPTFIAPAVAGGAIDPLVFQLTVTDTSNLSSSAEVTINDKGLIAPPNCSGAYPSVATLWPPSHEMINVSILGVKDPTDPNVKISITSIEQDEPTTGTCSGDTPIDGVINTDGSCLLRAERGTTNGNRTYYVNFSATDQYGNCCNGQVTVGVPPTSGGSCSPRGAHYNSFQ